MFPSPDQASSVSRQEKETIGSELSSTTKEPPAFPHRMQLVRLGEELSEQNTPPPFECMSPTNPHGLAEFPEIVQFIKVGEERVPQYTPHEFPEIVQFVRIGEDS